MQKSKKSLFIEDLDEDSYENLPRSQDRDLSNTRYLHSSQDENDGEDEKDEDEKDEKDEDEKVEDEKDESDLDGLQLTRTKSFMKVTFSLIFALYNDYNQRETMRRNNSGRYKDGYSIRDIAKRRNIAKSTVYFYFKKFRTNPYYIIGKYYQYRNQRFESIRKNKPKYYPLELELELVDWILRNRQEGLIVTGDEIMEKATGLIKCPRTKFKRNWLVKFMKRHNLSFRKPTHITKMLELENIKKKITSFHQTLNFLRQKFDYQDVNIINMDETAIFFDYNIRTVEKKGTKFVTRAQVGDEKRKITCVITVTASGTILRPLIIHNNKEILQLTSEDFSTNPIFVWTKNGWMDTDVMLVWFKKILLPHIKRKRTLLIFDSFRAHVSKKFEDELLRHDNIDLVLIPGGLTDLLQPLDVSLNKAFKTLIRAEWTKKRTKFNEIVLQKLGSKEDENLGQKDENTQEETKFSERITEIVDSSKKQEEFKKTFDRAFSQQKQSQKDEITDIKDENFEINILGQIKNSILRKKFKKGLFIEARKKNKNSGRNVGIPKISLDEVVDWIDVALTQLKFRPQVIQKSFRITGICPLLSGEQLHDFQYDQSRRKRVIIKKNRKN